MTTHNRHALTLTYVDDPVTGRRYPIPAGGSTTPPATDDGNDGDDNDQGDDDAGSSNDEQDDQGDDDGRAGGPAALAADNRRLREQRRAARARARELEAEVARLRGETESEVERAAREARESALAPAIRAVRTTAVETAARDLGFANPTIVARLVDLDTIDVDDETLDPDRTSAREIVEELARTDPYLLTDDARRRLDGKVGSGAARGGADTQNGTTPGGGAGSGSDPSGSFMAALRGKAGLR